MNQQDADTGTEFVLDNRKLIVAFLLLVFVCGAFFVIGFMEGKRQAVQTRVESIPPAQPVAVAEVAKGTGAKGSSVQPENKPIEDRSVKTQLDWYKNVQSGEPVTRKLVNAAQTSKAVAAPETKKTTEPKAQAAKSATTPSPGSMVPAANVTYTVQVGAFRQPHEAKVKADALKAKGYECVLEAPRSADQFYLVKVGKFSSRAEAKAMQLRLKQDGFSPSFIKVN
jgi:cell division protein FtsN